MQLFRILTLITATGAMGLCTSLAHATTTLKQVQISGGSQIDLLFDGKIQKGQIKTEFINDIIQLSISDVSVYPAKISSVNGGVLTKIFAYQYAPKLVRCRLTVKGKAEQYKDKFEVKAGGKILTIRIDNGAEAAPATAAKSQDTEERALMKRVLTSEPAAAPAAPTAISNGNKDTITLSAAAPVAKAALDSSSSENLPIHSAKGPKLGGGKPLPSPLKAFGKLIAVLGLFGLCALALKKFMNSKNSGDVGRGALAQAAGAGGFFSNLSRLAKKNLSRNGKMIEVLSTHYLGPKKSIAVVRVAGRTLVLGVSNESINLITQLSGDEADPLGAAMNGIDGLDLGGFGITSDQGPSVAMSRGGGAMSAGNPVFADLLNAERGKPQQQRISQPQPRPAVPAAYREPVVAGASADSLSSVRAQIRNRLEGLKQL